MEVLAGKNVVCKAELYLGIEQARGDVRIVSRRQLMRQLVPFLSTQDPQLVQRGRAVL